MKNYRYKISDQIFIDKNNMLSKNDFFNIVRKVFNTQAHSNLLLIEHCRGKIKPEDFVKSKEFTADSDFSLYS